MQQVYYRFGLKTDNARNETAQKRSGENKKCVAMAEDKCKKLP